MSAQLITNVRVVEPVLRVSPGQVLIRDRRIAHCQPCKHASNE